MPDVASPEHLAAHRDPDDDALQAYAAADMAHTLAGQARRKAAILEAELAERSPQETLPLDRSALLARAARRRAEEAAAAAARCLRAALIAQVDASARRPHGSRWAAAEAQLELRRTHLAYVEVCQLVFEARLALASEATP